MTDVNRDASPLVYVPLRRRAVLRIAGEEARAFLQGLVSNDVDRVSATNAIYAALLTPQGKYLHDFFVAECGGALCLDCDGARIDDLSRRLGTYTLRAKVEIDLPDPPLALYALLGDGAPGAVGLAAQPGDCRPFGGGVAFTDPRLAEAGVRAILPDADPAPLEALGFHPGADVDYDAHRMRLGLPESGLDLVPDKSLLLECGFDELRGVDFDKGCYVGQEVTARMKHRNLVRKRLLPVRIDGATPPLGTPILRAGVEVGELRSSRDGIGLALLRLDHVRDIAGAENEPLIAGTTRVAPELPGWVRL